MSRLLAAVLCLPLLLRPAARPGRRGSAVLRRWLPPGPLPQPHAGQRGRCADHRYRHPAAAARQRPAAGADRRVPPSLAAWPLRQRRTPPQHPRQPVAGQRRRGPPRRRSGWTTSPTTWNRPAAATAPGRWCSTASPTAGCRGTPGRRAAALGYTRLYWYRDGIDAWQQAGLPVQAATPEPLP